jgi:HSP20 family molecular chaperone IbpA
MSLIETSQFPRSMFDWDSWYDSPALLDFRPTTLDIFDPFDELDRVMSRNLLWLNKPESFTDVLALGPKYPEKHRITVDCSGYNPASLKTELKDDKLIVTGKERKPSGGEDYSISEFKRTFELPKNVDKSKMVSFVTSAGQLVVELPFRVDEARKGDVVPRLVDGEAGRKHVELNAVIPENIDPTKLTVTCKDRDLIMKADYKVQKPDGVSKVHYYRRTTLPDNTDFDAIKCTFDNNLLSVTAPLSTTHDWKRKTIPIDFKTSRQQKQLTEPMSVEHQTLPLTCPSCKTTVPIQVKNKTVEGFSGQVDTGVTRART